MVNITMNCNREVPVPLERIWCCSTQKKVTYKDRGHQPEKETLSSIKYNIKDRNFPGAENKQNHELHLCWTWLMWHQKHFPLCMYKQWYQVVLQKKQLCYLEDVFYRAHRSCFNIFVVQIIHSKWSRLLWMESTSFSAACNHVFLCPH